MNTVNPSSRVCSLFPPGVAAAELCGVGDPSLLLPAEAAYLGRAVVKRVQEFAAGRLCARRALAEFAIADFPIRVADDRRPIWPDTIVGSITHTAGFSAAAVAERRRIGSLGIDSEVVGDVNAEIWPSICTALETAWLHSLPPAQRAAAVTLVFSAKEAFYKCQYPLTCEPLDFRDLWIEAAELGGPEGVFEIHPTRNLEIARYTAWPLRGRYLFHEKFVTTGVALEAAPQPAQ